MLPDVKLNNYYNNYIYKSKVKLRKYKELLEPLLIDKDKCYDFIINHKDIIENILKNKFDKFKEELIDKVYNDTEHLYNTVIKLHKNNNNELNTPYLITIIKYCNILRNINKYETIISYAKKQCSLNYKEYKQYAITYYEQVHKFVLQGKGYKFDAGIGTYVINHWRYDRKCKAARKMIDFAKTNSKKKELLAQGVEIYDDKKAAWYEARHIPYKAVDYRVYKDDGEFYEFTFINSLICKKALIEYQRTEYVDKKYRGLSYTEICDKYCKTDNDIYKLKVDIRYKLNMLLYRHPNLYLNFVRNADGYKYKY